MLSSDVVALSELRYLPLGQPAPPRSLFLRRALDREYGAPRDERHAIEQAIFHLVGDLYAKLTEPLQMKDTRTGLWFSDSEALGIFWIRGHSRTGQVLEHHQVTGPFAENALSGSYTPLTPFVAANLRVEERHCACAAFCTSLTVTRPPDPVPATCERSTPSSMALRSAAGVACTSPFSSPASSDPLRRRTVRPASPKAPRVSSSSPGRSKLCSRPVRMSSSLPLSTSSTVSPTSSPSKTLSSSA